MELLWLLLVLVSVAILVFYKPTENMTNKDLLDTLDRFEKDGTRSKKSSTEIYGPKNTKAEDEPEPATSVDKYGEVRGYPDIYGPEITPIPGKKHNDKKEKEKKNLGEQSSDNTQGETYEFNPDFTRAFPHDENGPQPFLADFSKIQR
jgi:hypothetical protein